MNLNHSIIKQVKRAITNSRIQGIIILTGLMIYQLMHHQFIYAYADDWCYGPALGDTLRDIFNRQKDIYFNWSGRIIFHSIVHIFNVTHFVFWQILNPIIIVSLIVGLFKIITINRKEYYSIQTLIFLTILVLSLSTTITREVYYWLMGSVVYLWPLSISMVTFYLFYKYYVLEVKKLPFGLIYILPALSLISGLSNEQTGLVNLVLYATAIIWKKKYLNKNIKQSLIPLSTLIIGYIIMITAPGNFARLGESSVKAFENKSAVEMYLIQFQRIMQQLFHGIETKPIILLLLLSMFFYSFKLQVSKTLSPKINSIIPYLLAPYVFIYLISFLNADFAFHVNNYLLHFKILKPIISLKTIIVLLPYMFWAFFILLSIYYSIIALFLEKEPILLSFLLASYASAFFMIITSKFPSRSFFPFLLMYIGAITYLFNKIKSDKTALFLIFSIWILTKWLSFGLVLIGLGTILHVYDATSFNFRKNLLLIPFAFFLLFGFGKQIKTTAGYLKNSKTIEENNRRINQIQNTVTNKNTLTLKKINSTYGFNYPYLLGGDWMIPCFKAYYNLPEDIEIHWEN